VIIVRYEFVFRMTFFVCMLLGVISCVQEELDGFKQAYLLIEILCMRSMLDKWVKSSCLKMVALSHGNSHNHMPFIQASE